MVYTLQTYLIFILKIIIAMIFFDNIAVAFMGYAFTGKGIYIFMIMIVLYTIYSIFFRASSILNIGIYIIGFIYISSELKRYLIEYGLIYSDNMVSYCMTLFSFLILIYISVRKLIKKYYNNSQKY